MYLHIAYMLRYTRVCLGVRLICVRLERGPQEPQLGEHQGERRPGRLYRRHELEAREKRPGLLRLRIVYRIMLEYLMSNCYTLLYHIL